MELWCCQNALLLMNLYKYFPMVFWHLKTIVALGIICSFCVSYIMFIIVSRDIN